MLESEDAKSVSLCYKHLDKFVSIYPKDKSADGLVYKNEIPENVKVTVYCNDDDGEEGFLINLTSDEIGLEVLIAEKWILHEELEALAGCKID